MYALKSPRFGATPPRHAWTIESLFASRPVEPVGAGCAAIWEGDPATEVLQVASGMLRAQRILFDGRRAVVGFLGPGDMIGLCSAETHLHSAEAVTDAGIRRVPRRMLRAVLERSPDLRPAAFAQLRDAVCAAQEQFLVLLHQSADERVANFLVAMARRYAGEPARGMEILLPMPRADIADYLGVTVETVCRSMTKLRAQGVISLLGPAHVVIERPGRLLARAGEPSAVA